MILVCCKEEDMLKLLFPLVSLLKILSGNDKKIERKAVFSGTSVVGLIS